MTVRRVGFGERDAGVATGATALLGAGTILTLTGLASDRLALALVGAGIAAVALVPLLVADWLDGLSLVAIATPLPALFSSASIRIATVAPLTAIVVLAWLLRRGGRDWRLGSLPRRSSLVLLAVFVVTTVLAEYPLVSLRELLNIAVLAGFTLFALDALARAPRRRDTVVLAVVFVATVCGGLALLEAVNVIPGRFPRWGTAFNRAALGFGQPNGLGLFLAVALPLVVHCYWTAVTPFRRWLAAGAIGVVALGLTATFSRGSWLSVLGGAAVLLAIGEGRRALRIWMVAGVVAVMADVGSGGALRDTVARTFDDWVIEQRAALMFAGVMMFLAHPLFGVGPGGFAESLDQVGAQIPWLWDYLPTPHNAYVQMAAESGLPGLVAFVTFLGAMLLVFVRQARAVHRPAGPFRERSLSVALTWSLSTVCLAGLVVWPLAHGTGQLVALVAALGLAERPDRSAAS